MSRPLQVGDLCMTVNTTHPACNEGVLVSVVQIDPTQRYKEQVTPYLVRRVDGLPHISTTDRVTGAQSWCKFHEVWCAGYKLKRVDVPKSEPINKSQRIPRILSA